MKSSNAIQNDEASHEQVAPSSFVNSNNSRISKGHRRNLSIQDTRKVLCKSRKEGINVEKQLKSPNGVEHTIDLLNSNQKGRENEFFSQLINQHNFNSARNDMSVQLNPKTGNMVYSLKGIKGVASNKRYRGSKSMQMTTKNSYNISKESFKNQTKIL